MKYGKRLVSNSMLSTFKACRWKYWFSYVEGLSPAKQRTAPSRGALYHDLLDGLYKTGDSFDYSATVSGVEDGKFNTVPQEFTLFQNYPNPFNPTTMINYQLPITSKVELSIYNLLGQKVTTLVSKKQVAGTYRIEWNAESLLSGIYLYQLKAGDFTETRKLVLQK